MAPAFADCRRVATGASASAAGCLDAARVPSAADLVDHPQDGAPGAALGSLVCSPSRSGCQAPDCYFVRYAH